MGETRFICLEQLNDLEMSLK